MEFRMDLVLIVFLVILMYYQPAFLTALTTSVLGTIIAIILMTAVATVYGRNAGLLAALIFILLMHNQREGMENKSPKDKMPSAPVNLFDQDVKSVQTKGKLKEGLRKKVPPRKKVTKRKPVQTFTNKTDLENKMQKESYINSQVAKGENGGKGQIKKREQQ